VRDLHEDAGAVAGARVGADRAAVLEVAEDGERVLDQRVRALALDVGDEANPARSLRERRIVQPLLGEADAVCSLSPLAGRGRRAQRGG
jgi:hypothetical protein